MGSPHGGGWKPWETDNDEGAYGPGDRHRSIAGQALETKPSECLQGGTNLQAGGGQVRREVAKTWGRAAQGLESLTSDHAGDGAVRERNPGRSRASPRERRAVKTLKPAEAHERIKRRLHKASCLRVEGPEDVETSVGST
jgi:hypothetical protein